MVLIPLNGPTLELADDPVSRLATLAIKAGDFEAKPAKLLASYRTAGVAAPRLVMAGVGDGSPKNVRAAVVAALNLIKNGPGSNIRRVVLSLNLLGDAGAEVVRAAVLACGDASYSYTLTKSKATSTALDRLTIAVPNLAAAQAGFDKGTGLVKGVALAKEWGNRPANHATPTLLAAAAKALGKLPHIKVDVLGPKEVEKLGMGSFAAVARGSSEPLRFIVLRYEGASKTDANDPMPSFSTSLGPRTSTLMRGSLPRALAAAAKSVGVAWFAGRLPHSFASAMPLTKPVPLSNPAWAAARFGTAIVKRSTVVGAAFDLVRVYE